VEFGPHRGLGRHQVDLAVEKRGQQQVARHRDQRHEHLHVAGLEHRVDPVLHEPCVVARRAALDALVEEEEGAVERDADPDQPPLDHLIEVAHEGSEDRVAHALGQLGLELGGRERLLLGDRGRGRGCTSRTAASCHLSPLFPA